MTKRALHDNKNLVGLESMQEQFMAISSLLRKFHEQALVETLKLGDSIDDIMGTMKSLYIKGEIGMIMSVMRHVSPKPTSNNRFADFQERLIKSRNKIIANRSLAYLEKGNVFMAVGALHLPDKTGLVNLLRHQGYKLTPVNTSQNAG